METSFAITIGYNGKLWDVEYLRDYEAQLTQARETFGIPFNQRLRIERVRTDGQRSVFHPALWPKMPRPTSIDPPIFYIMKETTNLKLEEDSDIEILCTPPKRTSTWLNPLPRTQMVTPPPSNLSAPPPIPSKSTRKVAKSGRAKAKNKEAQDRPYTPYRKQGHSAGGSLLQGNFKTPSLRPRLGALLSPACSRCQAQKIGCNASGQVECYQCRKAHVTCSFASCK